MEPIRIIEGEVRKEHQPRPPEYSEEALALQFAERHAKDLRFVAKWGQWHSFDGRRWQAEETLLAFDKARDICREAAVRCPKSKIASTLASAKTVAAVERLAKADRRLAATPDQFDTDPWLLNTPDATIDLRTGQRKKHRPEDFITAVTGAATGGDAPLWRAFLRKITAGDEDLQRFLQRVAGCCLTGITRDHALLFHYGTGANGKSVYTNALAGVLGDYHRSAPIETFTASSMERHPTELAGLRGARLVTAVETEEGRRWAESKIKALTGGDKIAARFMRGDFFEFVPTFKLIISGNHKPGLRSVDEAIRRRLHLVPFTVTIPQNERNEGLSDSLKAEWPGVLAWMIEGCSQWQQTGLRPPSAVQKATAAYLEAEDAIAAWVEACCEKQPNAWETTSALYASWRAWAERTGEHVGATKRFVQQLEARGLEPFRRQYGRGFNGLKIIPPEPEGQPHWAA